jgi:AcrR family transcriptional regulator
VRRDQILDAAEALFARKGLEATTMDDVAERAELSKGALYLYYKSKDELFLGVVIRTQRAQVAHLERIREDPLSGLQLIARIARHYVELGRAQPMHMRLMLSTLATGQYVSKDAPSYAEHRNLTSRVVSVVLEAVERGKRDGTIRPEVDAQHTAMHLWGGLLGMMMIELNERRIGDKLPRGPLELSSVVQTFIDLLLRGIATPAGAFA